MNTTVLLINMIAARSYAVQRRYEYRCQGISFALSSSCASFGKIAYCYSFINSIFKKAALFPTLQISTLHRHLLYLKINRSCIYRSANRRSCSRERFPNRCRNTPHPLRQAARSTLQETRAASFQTALSRKMSR